MIIGVSELREVKVFDTEALALAEWGHPLDLASWVFVLYDQKGTWLEPVVTQGPRRWLGLRSGELSVTLRPNKVIDPATAVDPIGIALAKAETMFPNKHFQSLGELRGRFPAEEDH